MSLVVLYARIQPETGGTGRTIQGIATDYLEACALISDLVPAGWRIIALTRCPI